MTVHELLDALQGFPGDAEVILDLHSEYAIAEGVEVKRGYPNGGYISRPHLPQDEALARDYVHISTDASEMKRK